MSSIGLFFGSFNPVHVGHLMVAHSMQQLGKLDEVWFVVSPQNPFKSNHSLAHEQDRYEMLLSATADNPRFRVSDIEFGMPRPSYTIDTMVRLAEQFPQHSFSILLGSDNLEHLHKWKNAPQLLSAFSFMVYPRPGALIPTEYKEHARFTFLNVPFLDISATFIRQWISEDRDVRYFLREEVIGYIKKNGLYQTVR
jgi:nicotinate-nucleotide adenylyltransferase